jgi:hypothetical protein
MFEVLKELWNSLWNPSAPSPMRMSRDEQLDQLMEQLQKVCECLDESNSRSLKRYLATIDAMEDLDSNEETTSEKCKYCHHFRLVQRYEL